MRTVYVYRISLDVPVMTFDIPEGARLLHTAEQHGMVAIWCEIPDPEASKVTRRFELYGTGHPIPSGAIYIGTTLHYGGELVLHVYEVKA